MTGWELQSPGETKLYSFDWSLDTGEGIEESTWTINPDLGADTGADIGIDDLIDSSELITTVTVSGLTAGQSYQLKNVIRTNEGRTLSREITIRCANK